MDFQQNVLLKDHSNYKIGGPAKFFAEVETTESLRGILKQVQDDNEKVFILGGGTNILISDEGFNGLVIHNKIEGIDILDETIRVGSGVMVKDLLDFCIENSLTGLEWAGGLPGTVGGAVRGNAGVFKGEIKDSIAEVRSMDFESLGEIYRNNKECNFDYRNSIFKNGVGTNEFILSINLYLSEGDKKEISEKIQQKIDYRISRHPIGYPNIGSIFKNIPFDFLSRSLQKEFAQYLKTDPFPVISTTKILALCGLKGRRVGGAMISDKHPNFIVNIDNATSQDVKALIDIAKQTVKEKYNIDLEEEIVYLD